MSEIQESMNSYNLNLFLSPNDCYITQDEDGFDVYHFSKLGDHFYAFNKIYFNWDGITPISEENLYYDDEAKEWKGVWIDNYISCTLQFLKDVYTNKIGCFRRKIRFQKGLSKLLSLIDSNNSYINGENFLISKKLSDIENEDSKNKMKIIHKILETSFKGYRFINRMDDIYAYNEKLPTALATQEYELFDQNNTKGDFFTFAWNDKNPGNVDSELSVIGVRLIGDDEDDWNQNLGWYFSNKNSDDIIPISLQDAFEEIIYIDLYYSDYDPNKTTIIKLNNKKVIIDDESGDLEVSYDTSTKVLHISFTNFDFSKYNNTNGLIKISISQK